MLVFSGSEWVTAKELHGTDWTQ